MSLEEWVALCEEAPEDVQRLTSDYRLHSRVPFRWECSYDLFSAPPGSRVVGVWKPVGPEDALLKFIADGNGVIWRREQKEAHGWLRANQVAKPVTQGFLYLAQASTGSGPVKLGFSREPEKRAARIRSKYGLQVAFRVIVKAPAEPDAEDALHRQLRPFRSSAVRGSHEFYEPVREVLRCLSRVNSSSLVSTARSPSREGLYSARRFVDGLHGAGLPVRSAVVATAAV